MVEEIAQEVIEGDGEVEPPETNSMAAFSGEMGKLSDSLNMLYIPGNAGGRRIFAEKWPEVADYLLSKELIAFDTDGINGDEDRERRSELEEEADMRRVDIKQTLCDLVEKSVDAGSLQFEYVGSVIDKYGAGVSQYLYDSTVIERVRPGVMASVKSNDGLGESNEEGELSDADVGMLALAVDGQAVAGVSDADFAPVHAPAPDLEQIGNIEQTQDIERTHQDEKKDNLLEQEALPVITEQSDAIEDSGEKRLSVEEKDILSNKMLNVHADVPADFAPMEVLEKTEILQEAKPMQEEIKEELMEEENQEEELQDFKPVELKNLQEVMEAQKLPDMEEMIKDGILAKEGGNGEL